MKNKAITHIILEGVDGIGKSTIDTLLWKSFNFRYKVYVRGELSDYVYAKEYGRKQIFTQNGLPFLYVLLTADKETIKKHLVERDGNNYEAEFKKYDRDNALFIQAAKDLSQNYNIIVVDVSGLSVKDSVAKIHDECIKYIESVKTDEAISPFNMNYKIGADRAGIRCVVKQDQLYYNSEMIMPDYHLQHNGSFETYDCSHGEPMDSLVYCISYNEGLYTPFDRKSIDFVYPINSKIIYRPEACEYMEKLVSDGFTVLTTESKYTTDKQRTHVFSKVFGDNYIKELSKAKATVYCSRDLAHIEMLTARIYESCLANNIIFVDRQTDPKCKLLAQMHQDRDIVDLLYVDVGSVSDRYRSLMKDEKLIDKILNDQNNWFNMRKEKLIKEVRKNEI